MKINKLVIKKNRRERKIKISYAYIGLYSGLYPLISLVLIALFLLTTGVGPVMAETLTEKVTFKSVKNETIKASGKIVGRYFFVEFNTLSYVNPATFGYFISVFENQQIPYGGQHKPVASYNVTCTTAYCSHALEAPITKAPYIVGIGSSHSLDTVSTTLNFTPGNTEGVLFNPSVSVLELGINSVVVAYEMPPGYKPIDSKSWVGIWQGEASSTISPIGKADINSLQSYGSQAINKITIRVGTTYTIGLFSGPKHEDIVAIAIIKIKPY